MSDQDQDRSATMTIEDRVLRFKTPVHSENWCVSFVRWSFLDTRGIPMPKGWEPFAAATDAQGQVTGVMLRRRAE